MLAIFVGVRAEHLAADKHIEVLERTEIAPGYRVSRGTSGEKPVLVCRTALGEERIKGIVDTIIHDHPVSAIVSARMASGIPRDLRVGDLAFCLRTLLFRTGEQTFQQPNGEVDRRLLELGGRAATRAGIRHMVGDCVTFSPLQPLPVPRDMFGEMPNVVTADTEGYWLAEAAFEHDVPFLSVRASLGEVYDKLPESIAMLGRHSHVTLTSILRQNLAHPTRLPNFIRLVDAVRTCNKSLTRFFAAFLDEWTKNPNPSHADQR